MLELQEGVMAFTFNDMLRFAAEAWGPLGTDTVHKWAEFNERYFDGALLPIPLVLTNTQPYSGRLAFCSYVSGGYGRTITLNVPKAHDVLLADNHTLLHEMIHQFLSERGEDAAHDSAGWRREIMRLHHVMTGRTIWAGRSTTARSKIDRRVVERINVPNPVTGEPSLGQMQIARWPHDQPAISVGTLGSSTETKCYKLQPEAAT
jgi:hypothetical protein